MEKFNSIWLILFAAILLLFLRLGSTTVFQVAEARNAECAAEMMRNHQYIVPVFNGKIRTDKPPLHYYAMMAAYSVAGKSEVAARFFSAICGILVVAAVYVWTRKHYGNKAAILSALILLSSLHVCLQFRLATPDPYLILTHLLALLAFHEGYVSGNRKWIYAMHLFLGFAILAKGPVGLLLPAFTIFVYLLSNKDLNATSIRGLQPIAGILVIAAVALPWYLLAHKHSNGEWTRGFFLEHNIGRFKQPTEGHKGPFFMPLLFLLGGLFPFSLFLPRVIITVMKDFRRDKSQWLLLVSAACIVLLYSVSSTKLINYTSPAYPFLAIIMGVNLSRVEGSIFRAERIILAIITMAIPVTAYILFEKEGMAIPEYTPLLFLLYPIAAIAAWILLDKSQTFKALQALAVISMGQVLVFFGLVFPSMDRTGSVYRLKNIIRDAPSVIAFDDLNDAFVFYRNAPISLVKEKDSLLNILQQQPGTVVIEKAKQSAIEEWRPPLEIIAQAKDLFSSRTSFIYRQTEKIQTDGNNPGNRGLQ
ncbi:ArnT family glycosyltransferase [Flavihumibacter stibioxidans]|uniref:Glycosyltransferase RgtA/B/C/D-like domain-containing protein n=1 Tax=Flavihumibacter stibioxidans TaxID=1834163 RepID=A0ABR7M6D5_9BACT|nr:glycosyltransferase family 39 protein [Flavihumibacter stibioxidans]MBC6490593.1 hypothetical protein [Flavihumibacter stibioxidans]